ncbi:MAG: M15 family metallopeptidase, partial [Clostridia bacterium]|nr:M15 family metallopeptidase [Clostridia bacterium]
MIKHFSKKLTRPWAALAALLLAASLSACGRKEQPSPESSETPDAAYQTDAVQTPAPTALTPPSPVTPMPTVTPDPKETVEPGYMTFAEKTRLVNFENRLEDDFVPHDLINAREYLGDVCETKLDSTLIQLEVAVHFRELLIAARDEGVTGFRLNNAYRTMRLQWEMWEKRLRENPNYGYDPHRWPVGTMPGNASEHVAGLALDITAVKHPTCDAAFGNTQQGRWLRDNAYRFGFVLRYPEGKEAITGVHYEAWHFRYVGRELAELLYKNGACLEEYYGYEYTP